MTGIPLGDEIDDLRQQLAAVTAALDAGRAYLQEIGEWASQGRQGKRHCDLRELQGMVDAALREIEPPTPGVQQVCVDVRTLPRATPDVAYEPEQAEE